MVSKNQQKQIQQLKQKKYRQQSGMFVVEGLKSVQEFCDMGWQAQYIFTTLEDTIFPATVLSQNEMQKITYLNSPSPALAVFEMPDAGGLKRDQPSILLDGIADPGNLGTIIRLADWFGYHQLVCSIDTVDCYNPKVVQASMGSLSRIGCFYTDLNEFIDDHPLAVYATLLQGKSIYTSALASKCSFLMGSESHGIRKALESRITEKITIPSAPNSGAESLNVATATAIVLSEHARQQG